MTSFVKTLLLGTAGTIAIIFVAMGYHLGPKFYYMKSEYVTADVIRAADSFVTQNPKKWPKTWQDLGGEDLSRYTDFRFDLTTEAIVNNRQLIYTAIQPQCHRYRTYPHSRALLDTLYEKLATGANAKTSTPSQDSAK